MSGAVEAVRQGLLPFSQRDELLAKAAKQSPLDNYSHCRLFVGGSCDLSPLNAFDSSLLQNIRLIPCFGKQPANYF